MIASLLVYKVYRPLRPTKPGFLEDVVLVTDAVSNQEICIDTQILSESCGNKLGMG